MVEHLFGGTIATSKETTISPPSIKQDAEEQITENLRYLESQKQLAKQYAEARTPEHLYAMPQNLYQQQVQQKEAGQQALISIEKSKQEQEQARQQIQEYKSQVEQARQETEAYQVANNIVSGGTTIQNPNALPPRVRYYYEQMKSQQDAEASYKANIANLTAQGFKPVYETKNGNTQLTGFEDINKGISIPLSNFTNYITKTYPAPTTEQQQLYNDFQNALKQGTIFGYSGRLITPAQEAKAEFLNKVLGSSMPAVTGEYFKGVTPQGQEVLTRVQQYNISQLPPVERLTYNFPAYAQVQPIPVTQGRVDTFISSVKETILKDYIFGGKDIEKTYIERYGDYLPYKKEVTKIAIQSETEFERQTMFFPAMKEFVKYGQFGVDKLLEFENKFEKYNILKMEPFNVLDLQNKVYYPSERLSISLYDVLLKGIGIDIHKDPFIVGIKGVEEFKLADVFQVGLEFVPTTPLKLGELYAIGKALKFAPFITGTVLSVSGAKSRFEATTDIEKIEADLSMLIGASGIIKGSPLKFGKLEAVGKEPEGLSEGLRRDIALEVMKGKVPEITNFPLSIYIGGSSSLEAFFGKKLFREGKDLDIIINPKDIKDIPSIIERVRIGVEKSKDTGTYVMSSYTLEQLRSFEALVKEKPSDIRALRILETKEGKPIVELLVRPEKIDRIVDIQGIKFRDPQQVISDKEQVIRVTEKGIEEKGAKYEKAKKDIELVREAEKTFLEPRTIYRGLYLQIREAEVIPLIGYGEKGFIKGMPTIEQLPSLKFISFTEEGLPKLARGNIESYPQSAFQTTILTDKEILKGVFKDSVTAESDISRILILKEERQLLKDQASAFIEKFPEQTKILSPEETKFTIDFLKENKVLYERVYGSFSDIAQTPKNLQREAHDIEVKLLSEEAAKTFGELYEKQAKAKGFDLKLKEEEGFGIYKGKEKAIELKFKGDVNELIGGTGFRYGFAEERANIKIEGITSQSQFEQLVRKSATSTTWFKEIQETGKEVNIAEVPLHRAKDIPDVYRELISLGKSKEILSPELEAITGKGKKALRLAEEFRASYEEIPTGISKERVELRKEVIELFKELPEGYKIELTSEFKKSITKTFLKPSSLSILSKQSKSIYNSFEPSTMSASVSSYKSSSISPYTSPSISPSVSKSVSPSASPYFSPSVSPSKSPSPSPYLSPSPYPSPSPSPYPYPYPKEMTKELAFLFEGKKKKGEGISKQQAYEIFIKEPTKTKFTKVPNKNLTKTDAENLGAYLTDNSTARSFFIKPTKAKPKPIGLDIQEAYFQATQDKFRPYKIKQGKKIQIKGYIEKSPYLIDTEGEVNELSYFKELKQLKQQSQKSQYGGFMNSIMNM